MRSSFITLKQIIAQPCIMRVKVIVTHRNDKESVGLFFDGREDCWHTSHAMSCLPHSPGGLTQFPPSPGLNQFANRRLSSFLTNPHFRLVEEPRIEIRLQSINSLCHYRISSIHSMVTNIWKCAQ